MEDRIGASAHRHIENHGVVDRILRNDFARQNGEIEVNLLLDSLAFAIFNDDLVGRRSFLFRYGSSGDLFPKIHDFCHLDNALSGATIELATIHARGKKRAVCRERNPDRFAQAVHAVGGEHSQNRIARWAFDVPPRGVNFQKRIVLLSGGGGKNGDQGQAASFHRR